jgi:hypothetical protein
MKAALSLTLVLALMTSALPVTAHESNDRTAGRAIRVTVEMTSRASVTMTMRLR